jgi:hypothetical protein
VWLIYIRRLRKLENAPGITSTSEQQRIGIVSIEILSLVPVAVAKQSRANCEATSNEQQNCQMSSNRCSPERWRLRIIEHLHAISAHYRVPPANSCAIMALSVPGARKACTLQSVSTTPEAPARTLRICACCCRPHLHPAASTNQRLARRGSKRSTTNGHPQRSHSRCQQVSAASRVPAMRVNQPCFLACRSAVRSLVLRRLVVTVPRLLHKIEALPMYASVCRCERERCPLRPKGERCAPV